MAEEKNTKSKIAEREEEILKFWQENKIFQKSLEKPAPKGNFVFYDGPPFATGLPHYGHILPGTIKDVIPRYKTMLGNRVLRRWGWDCHGLPIENLVEKELGLSSKKDIEIFGVEKFNLAARNMVMRYADEWKKIVPRVGRWVDMENDYKTMDTDYTESVWWSFKTLYDKGLVYKSFKVMYLCPHCETTLSNFEVNQGYKDITDISVYVKFKVAEKFQGKDIPTYLIAWTTTPWTLPGNVALAVNAHENYSLVDFEGGHYLLLSKSVEKVFKDKKYEILKDDVKGSELEGLTYKPLFPYYENDQKIDDIKNGFKVYHGDFVTTTDGTGIVHIAPAFGEDDMNLGKAENLPFVQHVNIDGTFKKEVLDFAGQKVKPKDDHQKADVEVIKFLAKKGTLFEKEKIVHSYPHCWRCETPLLNYATTSWFIKVTEIKDKMVKLNENISWSPKEIGEGRFGKWLLGARDWAISRSRYWGAPLPVWENDKKELIVIGSIDELKEHTKKSENIYIGFRHGEAEHNVTDICSATLDYPNHLTDKGREDVRKSAEKLKNKKITKIIISPFVRAKETADIIAEMIGYPKDQIETDERLGEYNFGQFNLGPRMDYVEWRKENNDFYTATPGGESLLDAKKRIGGFLYDLENKYSNETILFVAHGIVFEALPSIVNGYDAKETWDKWREELLPWAEFKEYSFVSLPHNENYELDLHRPYIDEIELVDENGSALKRIPEVFDCWLESGSMPFAQVHYPFENKEEFENKNGYIFPADFIAEGLDQTRGWFYTLLVLGTGLFEKSPYNSVIVNGMILAEDGRKMSKSLNNYPDIMYIVDKYGADSLRYYLMSSPAVKAEDLNFSEKGVEDISKKVILKLENVLSFYEIYRPATEIAEFKSKRPIPLLPRHILDKWILTRLFELQKIITASLDVYRIDSAARPILDFIDDFSTWYIRRSRDRFKSEDVKDKNNALATTHFVLLEMAKYIAPFMPFFAEHIYLKLKSEEDPESVHLCDWPEAGKIDEKILKNMEEVRKVVSLALEKRMAVGIKVRQPLSELKVKSKKLEGKEEYLELIKDEVNVKNISFDEKLEGEVELDTEITEELQKEGDARSFIRAVQELRKNKNLVPSDVVELMVDTNDIGKEFLDSVTSPIKKPTNVSKILFQNNDGEELKIGEMVFKIKIK